MRARPATAPATAGQTRRQVGQTTGDKPARPGDRSARPPATSRPDPGDKPELVSFALRPRNLAGLQAQVAVGMPGDLLTVSQFAASYGQPAANVAALRRYLS